MDNLEDGQARGKRERERERGNENRKITFPTSQVRRSHVMFGN